MAQTLLWSLINDQHNTAVITKENADLKKFVPRTVVRVAVTDSDNIVTEEDIEHIVNDSDRYENEKFNIMKIINDQCKVIDKLTYHFKYSSTSDNIEWEYYREKLQWILTTSIKICTFVDMTIDYIPHNTSVQRSSYKFCTVGTKCISVYNDIMKYNNKFSPCDGDHFTHHKIARDLHNLIAVLDENKNNIYQDLRLGLNTLGHVLDHVRGELSTFDLHLKNENGFDFNEFYKQTVNTIKTNNSKKPNKYNRYAKKKR